MEKSEMWIQSRNDRMNMKYIEKVTHPALTENFLDVILKEYEQGVLLGTDYMKVALGNPYFSEKELDEIFYWRTLEEI